MGPEERSEADSTVNIRHRTTNMSIFISIFTKSKETSLANIIIFRFSFIYNEFTLLLGQSNKVKISFCLHLINIFN